MIAIFLLGIASSAIGWKMHHMIAKKRFRSLTERLHSRLQTCRQLSINMQSDWEGILKKERDLWVFYCKCVDDPDSPSLPCLKLDSFTVLLNDKYQQDSLRFCFTASGDISPGGTLQIQTKTGDRVNWNLSELLCVDRGDKLGPVHPETALLK